jgi:hypothetical protein
MQRHQSLRRRAVGVEADAEAHPRRCPTLRGPLEGGRSDPTSSRHLASHTSTHTSRRLGPFQAAQEIVGDVSRRLSPAFHSVWGRVVPDIPDFCRELVAALAEE